MYQVRTEDHPDYKPAITDKENSVISEALNILENRMKKRGDFMSSPDDVKSFLMLHLSELEHEVFSIMFLDNQHRLISFDELFRGTINGASVHPREVVKESIKHNAAAVIFAHNHPSGTAEPSSADRHITKRLVEALGLIDVKVLDHIVVGEDVICFSERGWI